MKKRTVATLTSIAIAGSLALSSSAVAGTWTKARYVKHKNGYVRVVPRPIAYLPRPYGWFEIQALRAFARMP